MSTLPTVCIGPSDLFKARKCAVLNSRQSKRPCGDDRWVKASANAIRELSRGDSVFLTSVGLNTWELVVHLVNINRGRQIILVPSDNREEFEKVREQQLDDFALDPARTGHCLFSSQGSEGRRRKASWESRDKIVCEQADLLAPVSIREGGNLENLVGRASREGKLVDESFRISYLKGIDRVSYKFDAVRFDSWLSRKGWCYLTHWTRSSHGPYPGEKSHFFYHDLISSDSYPRSAFHTLQRIISEKLIRSSARFIRGGYQVVSFTDLHPLEALKLMRWRRRYVYYSFEPFGICIEKARAREVGIKPVIYGDDVLYNSLMDESKPFYQNPGSGEADWKPEREFRHLGDLDLRSISPDKILLITYSHQEAERLRQVTEYEVMPLQGERS